MKYLVLFLLISCVSNKQRPLISIQQQFEEDFNIKVDIPINFTSNINPGHAWCIYGDSSNSRHIVINKKHWNSLPLVHKRELLYHELGHCILYLRHISKVGIMRPRVYSTTTDGSNWDSLVSDMKRLVDEK